MDERAESKLQGNIVVPGGYEPWEGLPARSWASASRAGCSPPAET